MMYPADAPRCRISIMRTTASLLQQYALCPGTAASAWQEETLISVPSLPSRLWTKYFATRYPPLRLTVCKHRSLRFSIFYLMVEAFTYIVVPPHVNIAGDQGVER